MNTKRVKDIMVPLDRYGIVPQNATLLDAVTVYEEAMKKRDRTRQPFRAVLVVDDEGRIIGKFGQLAFLRALEPQHNILSDMSKLSGSGVSEQFMASIMKHYQFFQEDLPHLCRRATTVRVKDFMHPIEESIDESATLGEAIFKIVLWETLSILVTRGKKVVGLLRLDDLCQEVAEQMKLCESGNES